MAVGPDVFSQSIINHDWFDLMVLVTQSSVMIDLTWWFWSVNHHHDWFDLMVLVLHSIHIRDIWHALWCMWISISFGGIQKFSIFSFNAMKTWGKTFMIFFHHLTTWLSALPYLEVIWCTTRQLPADWKGDVVFNSPVLLPKPRLVL